MAILRQLRTMESQGEYLRVSNETPVVPDERCAFLK